MQRKITDKLVKWKKQTKSRLPLVLYGARQVGKTFIITEFARQNFSNMIYLNFELNPALKSIFEGEISPQRIIGYLETYFNQKIQPDKTLIFFDEIQSCERALTSLKYFAEEEQQYHIATAGSLLGVAINRENFSFPVGKVQIETLYPLDFEEFLWALDKRKLAEEIRTFFGENKPLPELFHKTAIDLFNEYLITGGMPAVAANYSKERDAQKLIEIKTNILNSYIADMAKYASPAESVKIRTAFDSMPAQLAKENKKFQYKLIKKGASTSHFGTAVDWLCASGIVKKCYRVEHGYIPLAAYIDLSAFKLYMSDTGLLVQKAGLYPQSVLTIQNSFKGSLMENFAAQSLSANGYELFYWESKSIAEVDFVINIGGKNIPIEVKSSDNVKSRSLNVYIKNYKPDYSIRISAKNFGFQNGIKSVPFYAIYAI